MACFVENTKKKTVYTRKELEALRYEGIEGQKKKKGVEVYCGFEPDEQKELDELLNYNHHNHRQQQRPLKEHKNEEPSLNFENTKKKTVYTRKELEALRYEGIEGQKKKGVEVYCGFGPDEQKELDELLNYNHHNHCQQQRPLNEHKNEESSLNFESTKKKTVYTRKELEALRYEGIEGQKKKWVEVYCGFGPDVQKEYDGLLNYNHHNHRQQKRPLKEHKNKEPSLNFGEESSQSAHYEIINMNTNDPASDLHPVSDEDGCSIDLGDCMESDDSDEEYSTIQKAAFFVTGEPDFDSGAPEDGLEYLRRVRWEAAHIPKVKIAKVDSSKLNKEQTVYMPQIPDIVKCPAHLMPLREWEDAFLADFSELRLVLSRLELCKAINDEKQMQPFSTHHEEENFCQPFEISIPEKYDMPDADGSCKSSDISMHESASNLVTESVAPIEDHGSSSKECPNSSSVPSGTSGNHPTLSTILGMDAVARVTMLRKHINMAETGSTLSKDEFSWLFALCAAVDTPLDADTSAALRSLLRKCSSWRAEKSELDEEVIMLNIMATISGKYFGQSEN